MARVTGASDGIGEAFARGRAIRGLNLVLVARRRDRPAALAAAPPTRHGIAAHVVDADLAHRERVARVVVETVPLDMELRLAAARFGTSGAVVDNPVEAELGMVDVNCRAVAALTHEIGRRRLAWGRGGTIPFSAIVAFQRVPRGAGDAASKAFFRSFAEGLRIKPKPDGVDIAVAGLNAPASKSTVRSASSPSPLTGSLLCGSMQAGSSSFAPPARRSSTCRAAVDPLPRAGTPGRAGPSLAGRLPLRCDAGLRSGEPA